MKFLISLILLLACSAFCLAQDKPATLTTPAEATVSTVTPAVTPTAVPTDPFEAQLIPRNSKFYIAPIKSEDSEKPVEGFETYLAAALRKKGVPVLIVADRALADFEVTGTADKKGAGFAKKWLLGDFRSTTSASMQITNLRTGVVAYADASHRASANKGLRSSAEKLAKYLKKKIEDDEKKMAKRTRKG